MKTQNKNNKCRQIRQWLYDAIKSRLGIEADWAQNHIANCPRCQQRLASLGKVNLALSVIKNQPHNLDLLSRANTQAIDRRAVSWPHIQFSPILMGFA